MTPSDEEVKRKLINCRIYIRAGHLLDDLTLEPLSSACKRSSPKAQKSPDRRCACRARLSVSLRSAFALLKSEDCADFLT